MRRSEPGYGTFAPHRSDYPPRYDTSTHELTEGLSRRAAGWRAEDVRAELHRRATDYLDARELTVHYYRIGFSLAFELPVAHRLTEFPADVLGARTYPWLIWLGWALEERWRVLAAASREKLVNAEDVLTAELTALGAWESYDADDGNAGLVTAALASALAGVVEHRSEHAEPVATAALTAAGRLVTGSVVPWFERAWPTSGPFGPDDLHNIRCITLFRGAQLASAVGSPHAAALQDRSAQVYAAWVEARLGTEPFTEGAGYDGFLLDSMTEWLAARADRTDLLAAGAAALRPIVASWADLALPGRVDLLAPLGDTEAEMPFWAGVAVRLCRAYDLPTEAAWIRRFPLARLAGNALADAVALVREVAQPESSTELATGRRTQSSSVTLRTGWAADDLLVAVGAGRTRMGHLHRDAGHVVVGWRERFWISDPGYQQYVAGAERDYTLGEQAHNAPVVDGMAQTERAAIGRDDPGPLGVGLDTTACYEALPPGATIAREVFLVPEAGAVVVRDELRGLPAGAPVATHWLAGAGLSWGFAVGCARLSDGRSALWIGNEHDALRAEQLVRHPGTRGSVHLRHTATVDADVFVARWVFLTDPVASWAPPTDRLRHALASAGV